MTQKNRPGAGENAPSALDFDPVKLRYRHDGCTPQRQVDFIRYLAECGCVVEACRRVGLSREAVYQRYRRADAASFRQAWDAALAGAEPGRPLPPPVAQPPHRPRRAIPPAAAVSALPGIMPASGGARRGSWQVSTSSTSSTSVPAGAETNGSCQFRQVHQLPRGRLRPGAPGREHHR